MRIQSRVVYSVAGKTFTSEVAARSHIQDMLGETVDRLLLRNILLGPGDRIKLVESMLKHAAELVSILDGCNDAPEDE